MLSTDLINGKPYWTHKHGPLALWYNDEWWYIGYKWYIGYSVGSLVCNNTVPYEASCWSYWNNGYFNFTATDVFVDLGL